MVVEPIAGVTPIVLPPISDVTKMVLTPILPLITVANATRKVLNAISAGTARSANIGSTWLANIRATRLADVRASGAPNISRSITRLAGTTNIRRPVTGCARPADVSRSIARLSGATDVRATTGSNSITNSAAARPRGQCRRNVTPAGTPASARKCAWTVAQELRGGATGQCSTC
jgi:hypothetical protein